MRIPDLEQMICDHENRRCKNCDRTKEQHIVMFVEDGPYSIVPVFRCMVNRYYYATTKGDCQYEEQECSE